MKSLSYFGYRCKYHFGKYMNLKVPVDVSLELSSFCNMKCAYCYHAEGNAPGFKRGIMEFETAVKIITQAARLGVHSLKFNWKGESTINPRFCSITSLAKGHASGGTFIERISNSNFKFRPDRDDIFRGLANQTKVKISFDSFIKEVFEGQRCGGLHGLTMQNIDRFYNHPARIKSETEIVIQAVRTEKNKDEDILGQARKRWPEASVSIRDMVAGRCGADMSKLEVATRSVKRRPCEQAFVRVIFNHEGDAFPCCPDVNEKLNLGNIYRTDLATIFNGAKANELRDALADKSAFKFEPCASCSSFESYANFKRTWKS